MPSWMSLSFQDSGSLNMMELSILHDYVLIIMLSVSLLILYMLLLILVSKTFYKNFSESTLIETIWSIIPALLLMLLVMPSIKILYMVEDVKTPMTSYKIIAHQWYWSYISPLFLNMFILNKTQHMTLFNEQDSHMELKKPRLLNSINSMIIPFATSNRLLITSTDVIHSFSIPSLGLKIDAMPGRINQLYTTATKIGIYYGQCSEICGSNHSFMPIKTQICNKKQYDKISFIMSLKILNQMD